MMSAAAMPALRTIRPTNIFTPLPWQIAPWRDMSPVMLLTGSAGGGKSRLAAEKIHAYCLRYPGSTALMVRKTRESMVNSTVIFMERVIIGRDPGVAFLPSKHRFEYRNGSILAWGGMADEKQREQVRGIGQDSGLDICWLEEAVHFQESDYNELAARMRGKAGAFTQMLLTTNPDTPLHWIYTRLIQAGQAKVYYSKESDNKYNPASYRARLAQLTGVEAERLVSGKWVQASGLVFDIWSDGPEDGNVTEAAEYVAGAGPILWVVDDGYAGKVDEHTKTYTADSHPRVFLFCQVKGDGHLDIFDEDYAIHKLSNVHIEEAKKHGYPDPDFAIVGPGFAELKGQLFSAGVYSRQVTEEVEETIKVARTMLAKDENGFRRIRVHPRCRQLRGEMASYKRDDGSGKVIKAFDHGPDGVRYLAWTHRNG